MQKRKVDDRMKIKYSNMFFCLILFCACNSAKEKENVLLQNAESSGVAALDTVLAGLETNYVIHISKGNLREELLKFYNASDAKFKTDSAEYFNAVNTFFKMDSSVLQVLVDRFKNDTTRCLWIYSQHPYSSYIPNWFFTFNKRQGAVVLIWSYLAEYNKADRKIITDPGTVGDIITTLDLTGLKKWLDEAKDGNWNISTLSDRFKKEFVEKPNIELKVE